MRRGNVSTKLPRESVLKIDKDCHVDQQLEREYVQDSIAILRKRHIRIKSIEAIRTGHGRHYHIHIDPPVDARTANRLQYLLGDDSKRVDYNQARINSGLPEWNKLFEAVSTKPTTIYKRAQHCDEKSQREAIIWPSIGSRRMHVDNRFASIVKCWQYIDECWKSIAFRSRQQTHIHSLGRRLFEVNVMLSEKYTLTITYGMQERLEMEMKRRCLASVPEVIRAILSEYVSTHPIPDDRTR